MPLHTTIDRYSFEQGFKEMGRDYYSTAGYDYLYETLDELDAEFDVIGICCDFTGSGGIKRAVCLSQG